MKLLFLNSSGQVGGAERCLLTLMRGLRELRPDWQLGLLLGEDGPLAARAEELAVDVKVLAIPEGLATMTRTSMQDPLHALRTAARTLRYRLQLTEELRQSSPDVVQSNGLKMHALLASLHRRGQMKKMAKVCHLHDYVGKRKIATGCRMVSRQFDRLVTISGDVRADLLACGADGSNVETIHNGVDLRSFLPRGTTCDLDRLSDLPPAPEGTLRIGLVGTFAKWKGHIPFLRALELLPAELQLRAYLIGGPIYQAPGSQHTLQELRSAAKTLCPSRTVGFTGVVEDIASAYRSLDVVVHASSEPEPFGMVLIEAMACGRPVIFSAAGGAKEVCQDGVSALAHRPGDAQGLARQIARLATDSRERQRLGQQGLASVRSFTSDRMVERFIALYESLAPAAAMAKSHPTGGAACYASA